MTAARRPISSALASGSSASRSPELRSSTHSVIAAKGSLNRRESQTGVMSPSSSESPERIAAPIFRAERRLCSPDNRDSTKDRFWSARSRRRGKISERKFEPMAATAASSRRSLR